MPRNTSDSIKSINITKSDVDEQHGILTITLATEIKSGIYSLEIDYEARVDNRTLQVVNFSDDKTKRSVEAKKKNNKNYNNCQHFSSNYFFNFIIYHSLSILI